MPFAAVPRIELMKLFDTASLKRLIYISAPAGYGKSFSVRMWLTGRGCRSAWVSLSVSSGQKPVEFCERFIGALCAVQPENSALKEIISHKSFVSAPFEFIERALALFCLAAREKSGLRYTLIIDDLHLVTNLDILKHLPNLILELPENATVCILSRFKPPDSFSELILKYAITVIEAEYLRFTQAEIKLFFASHRKALTDSEIRGIMDETNGWAIGLNAILLSGNLHERRKLISRYLEIFIKEQIWDKWDLKRRDFLLRISVADELSPEFCDAVTGRKDSADILDTLVRENAFISSDSKNIYRFHHLFQDFLQQMLECETPKKKDEFFRKAGSYHYKHKDYYRAIGYYLKCGDTNKIAECLKFMYNYNSPYASVEDTLSVIHVSVSGSIVKKHPFLLETLAWAAFAEGRGAEMEKYLDRYFKQLPKIILQNPASVYTAYFLHMMDYRSSITDLTKNLQKLPVSLFSGANTPSITQNMPFFHRSSRDFTECIHDTENKLLILRKTAGVLIGEEYDCLEELLRAGLAYECGDLNAAHESALSSHAKLKFNFAPEIKFCSFMLLAAILDAQGQRADALKLLDGAGEMIESHRAYYLNANFRAFACRLKLADGDAEAAHEWLKYNSEPQHGELPFYKLYRHFVTARAYITAGDYSGAAVLLKKLESLCRQYRRPLDIIEINILLAIVYRKKPRASENDAFGFLEKAVIDAQKYGYTQIFANEGAELSAMLNILHKRAVQKNYTGEIAADQLRILYIGTLAAAKHLSGLTGGALSGNLNFTDKQKTVMRRLCEGMTHKQIAESMGIKPSAVKSHIILIYRKLDVSGAAEAVIKIKNLGLL